MREVFFSLVFFYATAFLKILTTLCGLARLLKRMRVESMYF